MSAGFIAAAFGEGNVISAADERCRYLDCFRAKNDRIIIAFESHANTLQSKLKGFATQLPARSLMHERLDLAWQSQSCVMWPLSFCSAYRTCISTA